MLNSRQFKCRYSGFTLTELAIVLGIIGVILGGIWSAQSAVRQSQKIDKSHQQILTLVQNIRSLYGTHGTFYQTTRTDISAQLIATPGIIPSDMLNTTSSSGIVTPWNGVVNIFGPGGASNMTSHFEIRYASLPTTACKAILSMLIPVAASIGLVNFYDDIWKTTSTNPDITTLTCAAGTMSTEFTLR
jgi:prepilin-type N-terminal cleavage/methylation domain-containing protein